MATSEASRFLEQKSEGPLDGEKHENDITNANQQDVESGKTTGRVYQGDGQGEEDPADDIITDTSSQSDETNNGVEQFQLG